MFEVQAMYTCFYFKGNKNLKSKIQIYSYFLVNNLSTSIECKTIHIHIQEAVSYSHTCFSYVFYICNPKIFNEYFIKVIQWVKALDSEWEGSWFKLRQVLDQALGPKLVMRILVTFGPKSVLIMQQLTAINPKTLKYWVGVQWHQCYLMGRRCLFSFAWPHFQ